MDDRERPLRITTPLGDDALFVVGLEGREAISELFEFRLELVAPRASVMLTMAGSSSGVRPTASASA
mgnify:CR=1 FL=1